MYIGIVSLYNPGKKEIERISSYVSMFDRLIIMDDSEEDHREEFIDISRWMEYRWNGRNIGLCKSINKGIRYAIELGAEWILVVDQDSCLEISMIDIYKQYIKVHDIKKVALLAPQYNYDRHQRKAVNRTKRVHFANLSGSLFNAEAFANVGLFDERFVIDGLDTEWCLRAAKSGYVLIECSEAVLNHHPAYTKELKILGKVIFRYGWDKPERYYYQFRGLYILHKEYGDLKTDLFGLYKWVKAMVLFEKRNEYLAAWKYAKNDYKRGYYGICKYDFR